jgi:hypothetical protein
VTSARKKQLPAAIARFIEQQRTMPVDRLYKKPLPLRFPYAEYWRRAIACMMLSGRVQPKGDGNPNRTDITRICKEANFNPHLFERAGWFLLGADIVNAGKYDSRAYKPGKNLTAFWDHDITALSKAARRSFLHHLNHFTGHKVYRPTFAHSSALDDFVAVFAAAFRGFGLREDTVGDVLLRFSRLPESALGRLCKRFAPESGELDMINWSAWLDSKGQEALLSTLYVCEWAYAAEHRNKMWFHVSDIARALLGIDEPPQVDPLPADIKVLPDLSVFAGAGLPFESLAPFFRYCRIKRIDRVFEFQLDPKRLREQATKTSAVEEMRVALATAGTLPQTVEAILAGKPPGRGRTGFRACSAIVKPENAEVLNAIREHRRLKGYLEAGAPPGYLLIKYNSNPVNFVERCRELGFTVEAM